MTKEVIWEAVKTPLRQGLLFLYAFVLSKLFELAVTYLGFEFTPEQQLQLLGYGTHIVYAILSWLDKALHEIGKLRSTKKVESNLVTGLTRF